MSLFKKDVRSHSAPPSLLRSFGAASRHKFSFGPAEPSGMLPPSLLRSFGSTSLSPPDARERGAWDAPWVVPVPAFLARGWRLRVLTRPVEPPFSPAWTRGVRMGAPEGLVGVPWGLGSLSVHRFDVSGPSRRSWTLRFHAPGGSACEVRFASQARRCRHLPIPRLACFNGASGSETSHATPAAALSSRSFGRPRNLPQTGRDQYGARRELWDKSKVFHARRNCAPR